VTACKGTEANQVGVSWSSTAGAIGYEVWRNTSADSAGAVKLGAAVTAVTTGRAASGTPPGGPRPRRSGDLERTPRDPVSDRGINPLLQATGSSALQYTDATAAQGMAYFYWIKAIGAVGASALSAYDMGWGDRLAASASWPPTGCIPPRSA